MPFQSEKQRRYLWANEPEIARDWSKKYGSRVRKVNGGIMDKIMPYVYPEAHGEKYSTRGQWAKNTPQYHRDITENYFDELSQNWSQLPYVGKPAAAAIELFAPAATGAMSLPYDTYSAFKKFYDNPQKYEDAGKWSKVNDIFPGLADTNVAGILSALDREDMFSAAGNRFVGAARPLAQRMKKGWDAIKNEFSGSAQAATPDAITRAMQTRGPDHMQRRTNFPTASHMRRQTNFPTSTAQQFANLGQPHKGFEQSGADLDKWGNRRMDQEKLNQYPQKKGLGSGITAAWNSLKESPLGSAVGQAFKGQQLTPQQKQMNKQFFQTGNMGRPVGIGTQQNPFQMTSGPFQGMNAPGKSAFGSPTSQAMAQKWMDKFGGVDHQTQKMIDKKAQISQIAQGNQGGNNMGMPQGKSTSSDKGSYQGHGSHHFNRGGIAGLWPR